MKSPSTKLALATALAAAALLSLTAPEAKAQHDNRLERLSHSLEGISSELCEEFQIHYRHTSVYRHLVEDAHQIEDEANHIERLAHDPYTSLRHIRQDLVDLDELAHHLHELIDRTEHGHYGHVHGSTRHVHELLTSLTRVIHAMEDEVRDMMHYDHHDHGHHDHYGHREGVSFERGGFRLTFRR